MSTASSFDACRQEVERGLKLVKLGVDRARRDIRALGDEDLDALLRECRSNLQTLRQFPPNQNNSSFIVNKLTAEIARAESDYRQLQRQALLENTGDSLAKPLLPSGQESDRTRILRANQTLDASTALIRDMGVVMEESNAIGSQTLQEMQRQGEDLGEIRSDLLESKSAARTAAQALKRMAQRALYNRLVLLTIICLLLLLNLGFLWFGFIKS